MMGFLRLTHPAFLKPAKHMKNIVTIKEYHHVNT